MCDNKLMQTSDDNVSPATWRAATPKEWSAISAIAGEVHSLLPERPEVFEEKFRLFERGCLVLMQRERVVGYGIFHPWKLDDAPRLDALLNELPREPQCIFIHDVALLAQARGLAAAGQFVRIASTIALERELRALALVSVYGTHPLWAKYGFVIREAPALAPTLIRYGADARYMTSTLR